MHSISTQQLASTTPVNLIDVREPDEYANGHVDGARSIPLASLPEHLEQLRTTPDLHIICQSGGRSARAVDYLAQQGIIATNIDGGTGAWIAENRPVSM